MPVTNINVSPQMIQNMSASITVENSIEISNLLKEFENEVTSPSPDKGKLMRIKDSLMKHGLETLPHVVDLLIRNLH